MFNYFYLRRTISKRPGAFSYPDISSHPDLPPDGKFAMKVGMKKYLISALPIALIASFFVSIPGIAYFISFAGQYLSIADTLDFQDQWKTILKNQYDHALEFCIQPQRRLGHKHRPDNLLLRHELPTRANQKPDKSNRRRVPNRTFPSQRCNAIRHTCGNCSRGNAQQISPVQARIVPDVSILPNYFEKYSPAWHDIEARSV